MKIQKLFLFVILLVLIIALSACMNNSTSPYNYDHAINDYIVSSLNHIVQEQKVTTTWIENGEITNTSTYINYFDKKGNLIKYDHLADGKQVTEYNYKDNLRDKEIFTNAYDGTSEERAFYTYEDKGKLVSIESPGSKINHFFDYDPAGFCVKQEIFADFGEGMELFNYIEYVRDEQNRLKVEKFFSFDKQLLSSLYFTYDGEGRLVKMDFEKDGKPEGQTTVTYNKNNNPDTISSVYESGMSVKTLIEYTPF